MGPHSIRSGRYIGGLVPDVAFRRTLDHAIGDVLGGGVTKFTPRLSVGGYYSGVNDDNFDADTDGAISAT